MHLCRAIRRLGWAVLLPLSIAACGGGDDSDGVSNGGVVAAGAPVIVVQPVEATVDEGATVSFSASASGDATIAYQWSRDGVDIACGTGPTLSVTAAYLVNGASYRATASNTVGRTSSNAARLTVRPVLPTIVAQPAATTAPAGSNATFSLTTRGGTLPLAYQWQRNGVDIPGATTANYTTPAVAAADTGTAYRVQVSNPAGTVTSDAAMLTATTADGVLTVMGAGAAGAGGGGTFVPVGQPVVQTLPPNCVDDRGAVVCTSQLSIIWTEQTGESLVLLLSSTAPSPGVSPGTGVNGFNLAYSVFLGNGASLFCSPFLTGCDFPALGIVIDSAQRRVTFVNTPVSSAGVSNVVLSGTLHY